MPLGWEYVSKAIQKSLSRADASLLADSNYYEIARINETAKRILKASGIDISKKYLSQEVFRSLVASTKKEDYE